MKAYKLLTPGPLTTTQAVRNEMLIDRCTWDESYKGLTQSIRNDLLALAEVSASEYTVVLMQGSGTFAVEATIVSTIKPTDKLLVLVNGAYGKRIATIADRCGIDYAIYEVPYNQIHQADTLMEILESDQAITHVAMVHCETTTGILNPIASLSKAVKDLNKTLIIDAMSSFGGIPIDVKGMAADYLISSSNKCIQGVPGFGFVIAKKTSLLGCKDISRSLALDLYDQWLEMHETGKWRFTSPTHTVAAFKRALEELAFEGGTQKRFERYRENNEMLRKGMQALGFKAYLDHAVQSPIITSFEYLEENFSFNAFYEYIKEKGFVLYPGKLTDVDTFRIGNIGGIHLQDIKELLTHVSDYLNREAK